MGITQAIVERCRRRASVSGRVCVVKCARCERAGARIQIQRNGRRSGGAGCKNRSGELDITRAAARYAADNRIPLNFVTSGIDQKLIPINLELSIAAVGQCAVIIHLEKSIAVNRDIQRVIGGGDVALCELLRNDRQLGTDADLGAATAG